MAEIVKAKRVNGLRDQLDAIDAAVEKDVRGHYYESRLRIEISMWEKGEAIGTFRGGKCSYYRLEKETERPHQHLKRWHQLYLKYPKKTDFLPVAAEKAKKWTEKMLASQSDWYQLSESGEWETPQWLFDLLNKEFHFKTDVCANKKNAKCKHFYCKEDDALSKKWTGVCWMNPPYGREIADWMKKARESAENGATIVCLVPARPDTEWWWENVLAGEIRFIRGRLKWPGSKTAAPFPSAVVILSNTVEPRSVVWWEISKNNSNLAKLPKAK